MDGFFVYCLFNVKFKVLGYNVDSNWLNQRLELFQKYTLKSLLNQTVPITKVLMICANYSRDILLPKINYAFGENPDMEHTEWFFSSASLIDFVNEGKYEYIYMLRTDSDDLYHAEAVADCIEVLPRSDKPRVVKFVLGYIYELERKRLYTTSLGLPFYCTVYPGKMFDYSNYRQYSRGDQTKVMKKHHPLLIQSRRYMILDHSLNISKDPRREGKEQFARKGQDIECSPDLIHKIGSFYGLNDEKDYPDCSNQKPVEETDENA